MLSGALSSFLAVLAFGFSTNYYYALAIRFLAGAMNGNLGVIKTYLAEISDASNQTKIFSLFSGCQGLSAILGAAAGGYLARPALAYPSVFPASGFFGQFPYFLVNSISAAVLLIGFAMAVVLLKESRLPLSDSEAEESIPLQSLGEESTLDVDDGSDESAPTEPSYDEKPSPKWSLLSDRLALAAALTYSFLGFLFISFDEVFSTWSIAPVSTGGLGFEPFHLGALGAWGGICIIVVQRWVYPYCASQRGLLGTYRVGLLLALPMFLSWPLLSVWLSLIAEVKMWYWWLVVGAVYSVRVLIGQLAFTAIIQMVNNSVPAEHLGEVNGFGQSTVALLRAVGPSIAGATVEASLALHEQHPGSQFIPFGCFLLPVNIFLLVAANLGQILPEKLNVFSEEARGSVKSRS